jgi:hypothetical protein
VTVRTATARRTPPDPAASAAPASAHILECEAELDRCLLDWRDLEQWNHAWEEPAARWSQEAWARALALGPLAISARDIAIGERVVHNPVFVCGAARSGTTLVRDLLDGHPELAVLPAEGRFFAHFQDHAPPRHAIDLHARQWLRNLANPNHQRPFWLLGRSDRRDSPYVRFARSLLAWELALARRDAAPRLLAATALAMTPDISQLKRTVDKTPGYEFHLPWIWSRLPQAKVVHLVRDPAAIAASYRAGLARTGLQAAPVARMLRNVAASLLRARFAQHTAPKERYLVVHYEDLAADRARQMRKIAAFLEIDWDDGLLEQTIMRRPAEPNSSFHASQRPPYLPANSSERFWLGIARAVARGIA